jgi:hypothetical protein
LNSRRGHLELFGRIAAVASLFILVNGHFGALQAVAWGKMLWSFTHQNGSLLVAAKQTFDGEHPCHMCDSIQEAKKQEKKSPEIFAGTQKIELFSLAPGNLLPERFGVRFDFPRNMDEWHEARFSKPPLPIPIGNFVTA